MYMNLLYINVIHSCVQYDSGEDVYKGNVASFTTKEVEKIKAKGVASFYNRKFKKWHCPYCTTKPSPRMATSIIFFLMQRM